MGCAITCSLEGFNRSWISLLAVPNNTYGQIGRDYPKEFVGARSSSMPATAAAPLID
jgi:hypothetical protein